MLQQTDEVPFTAGRQSAQGIEQSLPALIDRMRPVMVRMSPPHGEPIEGNIEDPAKANSIVERHGATLAPSRQGPHGDTKLSSQCSELFDSALLNCDINALTASLGLSTLSRVTLCR